MRFQRGEIPATEFYLLPLLGEPGSFHEWGYGLTNFLVEQRFRMVGLSLLNAAVAAGIATALYAAAIVRLGHRRRWYAFVAAIVATLLCEFRLVYRPETFLYLAVAVELYILERFVNERTDRSSRVLVALPVLAWALAQCHPSSFFLLVVIGSYVLQMLARGREGWRPAIQLATAGFLAMIAIGFNPYGFEQLVLPFRFQAAAELLDSLIEFLPAWRTSYFTHALLATGLALAAGAQAVRQRRIADVLLLVLFAGLAWRYARNIDIFAVVLALPLASLVTELSENRLRRLRQFWLPALPAIIAAATLWAAGPPAWGPGTDRATLPEQAVRVIAQQAPKVRVANFYHLGNYLEWSLPGIGILVDGRNFSHNRAVDLHDRILRADRDWEALLSNFGVDVIVTPATLPFSGQMIPLVAILADHPGWYLAAKEPAALTFIRANSTYSREVLAPDEIWRQAIEETTLTLRDNPSATSATTTLRLAETMLRQ